MFLCSHLGDINVSDERRAAMSSGQPDVLDQYYRDLQYEQR